MLSPPLNDAPRPQSASNETRTSKALTTIRGRADLLVDESALQNLFLDGKIGASFAKEIETIYGKLTSNSSALDPLTWSRNFSPNTRKLWIAMVLSKRMRKRDATSHTTLHQLAFIMEWRTQKIQAFTAKMVKQRRGSGPAPRSRWNEAFAKMGVDAVALRKHLSAFKQFRAGSVIYSPCTVSSFSAHTRELLIAVFGSK